MTLRTSCSHLFRPMMPIFLLVTLVGLFSVGAQGQVTYVGTWLNTTFSSTGGATFTIAESGLTIDMDGNVFGASNPPPRTLTNRSTSNAGVTYTKSNDGTYGNMTITVAFDGTFTFNFTNVPGLSGGSMTGSGSIDQNTISLNYSVGFAAGTTSASLQSGDPLQEGAILHFAQFGNGGGGALPAQGESLTLTSDIVLPNPSETETVNGTVAFGDGVGGPLQVDVEDNALATSVDFTIPPLGSTTISTTGLGDIVTGSAVVVADGPLGGVIRFAISDFPGVGSGIAGVPASLPLSGFITPARRVAGGINTGIAVRNVGSGPVNLTLSLRKDGSEVATANRNLGANGQFAENIDTLFPGADTNNFVGSVVVTSDGLIAATALEQGTGPGEFTTLPVTSLD